MDAMREHQKVVSDLINRRCEETAASFTSKIKEVEAQLALKTKQLEAAMEGLNEISRRCPDFGHEGIGTVARQTINDINAMEA